MSLYKGKYIIALYDSDDEELIDIYDNISEMQRKLGVGYLKTKISKLFHEEIKTIIIEGIKYYVHFVDITEDEEE